jgi:hypothetical protein
MSQSLPKRRTRLAGGQIPSFSFGLVKRNPNKQTEFNQSQGTEMKHSTVIRSALAAMALTTASLAHATDWSLKALEECGAQISGTFSTDNAGLVTSTNLVLTGGSCSSAGGIIYDSSAGAVITAYSRFRFAVTSSSIDGSPNNQDVLWFEFGKPLNPAGRSARGFNSLAYHKGGAFGGLTSQRTDRYADPIFIAGYAVPVSGTDSESAP